MVLKLKPQTTVLGTTTNLHYTDRLENVYVSDSTLKIVAKKKITPIRELHRPTLHHG